jgi:hypothetical protein
MSAIYCPEHANGTAVMDWGLVKKHVVDEVARLSSAGAADGRAAAQEECLRLAAETQRAREALADLRAALGRAEARARALEAALLEVERRFCRCGEAAPCGLHALVRRALDGDS